MGSAGGWVFAFDFAGAGQSEGEYLSLGYFEKDDLATVVDYLKENERVTRIGYQPLFLLPRAILH